MAAVTIVDVSYVAAPPHAPTKLNAMEAQWVDAPLLQYLLLFDADDHLPPFHDIVQSLRSSLVATLSTHAPLAGKIHYLADTGDVAICCSTAEDSGVRFVVAETDADAGRLARDEDHDVLTFERLVPEVDMTSLPAPVLAVQATRLAGGGGVALGFTVHHAVADGRSLWRFVEAWATTCRGDAPPQPPPCFDRSRVRMPGGDDLARTILRKYAPDLPLVTTTAPEVSQQDRLTRRTFSLDAAQIARLKETIVAETQLGGRAPSTFVAVIALLWTCAVRGRSIPPDDDVFLFFFADLRGRLDPPAGADYFGACLAACLATLPARELHADGALVAAAAAVQGAIQKMADDPLGFWPGWEFLNMPGYGDRTVGFPSSGGRVMNVSGHSGFSAYEAGDFGWGRPRRTENVTMNKDGQVELVRARDGGGVQVAVSMLCREHVDAFQSELRKLLG
nr:unnamed protein product [Digitaria exilis]